MKRRFHTGYTLIEMLVVMAIMAVLMRSASEIVNAFSTTLRKQSQRQQKIESQLRLSERFRLDVFRSIKGEVSATDATTLRLVTVDGQSIDYQPKGTVLVVRETGPLGDHDERFELGDRLLSFAQQKEYLLLTLRDKEKSRGKSLQLLAKPAGGISVTGSVNP